MELLDRLIGHDLWTTRKLIELCSNLPDEQLDQEFDIGHRTIRKTLDHLIWNIECWTDLMQGNGVRSRRQEDSMDALVQRFELGHSEFQTIACEIAADDRLDDSYLDILDNPPRKKTFGGTILHVSTHGIHHRAQLMYMLRKLGVGNIPEGDVLTWERAMRECDD